MAHIALHGGPHQVHGVALEIKRVVDLNNNNGFFIDTDFPKHSKPRGK